MAGHWAGHLTQQRAVTVRARDRYLGLKAKRVNITEFAAHKCIGGKLVNFVDTGLLELDRRVLKSIVLCSAYIVIYAT